MTKLNVILLSVFFVSLFVNAKDSPELAVSLIPAELIKDANLVIRNNNTEITLSDKKIITYTQKISATVFNKEGIRASKAFIFYNSFYKINDCALSVFDKDGKLIQKVKRKEFQDMAPDFMYQLFDDGRLRFYNLNENRFPFSFEFEYEVEISGWLQLPTWRPIEHFHVASQNARLKIVVPANTQLYTENSNVGNDSVGVVEGDSVHVWKVNGFSAKKEITHTGPVEILPYLLLKLDNYNLGTVSGPFVSWSDVGNFYSTLNTSKAELNEANKAEVIKYIKSEGTRKEKIMKAYNWMQSVTHYASIQNGIGGFQAYDANVVYQSKFGDCKGLVGFMSAVLKTIDIPSFVVLVHAGDEDDKVLEHFPSNYFNHVILCVPDAADTIWLECTNQNQAFNYLGSFTSNRLALLVNGVNSKLIHTPVYNETQNTINSLNEITIGSDLIAKCKSNINMNYECHDFVRRLSYQSDPLLIEKWINSLINQKDVKVTSHQFGKMLPDSASSNLTIDFVSSSVANKNGSRLFINASLIQMSELESINSQREIPYYYRDAFTQIDSTVIHLPAEFEPEKKKEGTVAETNEFGSLNWSWKYDAVDHLLLITKTQILKTSIIDPKAIEKWNAFVEKIDRCTNQTLVFVSH